MNIIGTIRKWDWKKIISVILFVTLILSIAYTIYKIATTSNDPTPNKDGRLRSDYVLMLIQCILGLVVMFIPSILERKLSVDIPDFMEIMYFIFLYCAIYLGEVHNFYYVIPHWDTILHAFSGAMLGALGFNLVNLLNNSKRINMVLSPFFVSLFAFCFALAVGALWEIYEYLFDGLLSLNMQKFALADGTLLVGREALSDTMDDLIVDAISALVVAIIGNISLKKKNKRLAKQPAVDITM